MNKDRFICIAGPCSIDTEQNLDIIAKKVASLGINYLRAGAFKPRTSPYSFKGLGSAGLKILKRVADKYNLKSVSEIVDVRNISYFEEYVDLIQIGARNMQNYVLLEEVGKLRKTVILKRGFMSTIDELLYSIDYLTYFGTTDIIICERGIRTFQKESRFSLDITSLFAIKERCDFPVIIDPSHSCGRAKWVKNASFAAIAAGADGIMVETHITPALSLSDATQTISLDELEDIVKIGRKIRSVI